MIAGGYITNINEPIDGICSAAYPELSSDPLGVNEAKKAACEQGVDNFKEQISSYCIDTVGGSDEQALKDCTDPNTKNVWTEPQGERFGPYYKKMKWSLSIGATTYPNMKAALDAMLVGIGNAVSAVPTAAPAAATSPAASASSASANMSASVDLNWLDEQGNLQGDAAANWAALKKVCSDLPSNQVDCLASLEKTITQLKRSDAQNALANWENDTPMIVKDKDGKTIGAATSLKNLGEVLTQKFRSAGAVGSAAPAAASGQIITTQKKSEGFVSAQLYGFAGEVGPNGPLSDIEEVDKHDYMAIPCLTLEGGNRSASTSTTWSEVGGRGGWCMGKTGIVEESDTLDVPDFFSLEAFYRRGWIINESLGGFLGLSAGAYFTFDKVAHGGTDVGTTKLDVGALTPSAGLELQMGSGLSLTAELATVLSLGWEDATIDDSEGDRRAYVRLENQNGFFPPVMLRLGLKKIFGEEKKK